MPIRFVQQVAGLCLLSLILVDIFLTVLYARAGSGLIAPHVERGFWRLIRRISTLSRRRREQILAFGGPLLVIAVVALWFVALSFAAALVIHPALGSGVRASNGETPASFIAALFAGGSSVSIVRSSALERDTEAFRLFYFFTALAGTAVTSLVLTYLMQVSTALLRRNTVALDIDTWSGQTADAVELLTRIRCARAAGRIGENAARHAGARKPRAHGQRRRERGSHHRFTSAVARLQRAGIAVTNDVRAGVAAYERLRADWDVPAVRLAEFLGYTPQQIDVSTERIVHARPTS